MPDVELRRLFNENRFWERVQEGELAVTVTRSRPAPIETSSIPHGCQSQELRYFDKEGNEVARVHQYLKPDGTIGASGLPDPKRVLIGDTLYRLVRPKDNQAPTDTAEG